MVVADSWGLVFRTNVHPHADQTNFSFVGYMFIFIQYFPDRGRQPQRWGREPIIWQNV